MMFRFRDGGRRRCRTVAILPISMGGTGYRLRVHIVAEDLPLLLSRDSLRRARAVLDLDTDTMLLKTTSCTVPLSTNAAGHLTLEELPFAARAGTAAASALAGAVEPAEADTSTNHGPAITAGQRNLAAVTVRLHKT